MVETGTVPACDRCYARKTRCDKLNPCKTCVMANAECKRTRNKNARRRRRPVAEDKIRTLTERLHELENLLHHGENRLGRIRGDARTLSQDAETEADHDMDSNSATSYYEDEIQKTPYPISRFCTGMEAGATDQAPARDVSSQPRGGEDSGIATSPKDPNSEISHQQREALEKVLAILNQFCQHSWLGDQAIASHEDANGGKDIYDLTSSDIINILTTPRTDTLILQSPSSMLTSSTTQAMGLSLLDGNDPHKALHYKAILNFEAAILLGQRKLKQENNVQTKIQETKIQEHMDLIKKQMLRDTLAKLDQISLRTPPSLSLLHAQCIGVAVLQYMGSVPEAWSMMVAVSRTFTALGFDTSDDGGSSLRDNATPRKEPAERQIAWCYQLDRSMSLVLRRPPLLRGLSSAPTWSLSSYSNELNFSLILLELAHIQGEIFRVTAGTEPIDWKDIEPLHSSLIQLHSKIENWTLTASDTLTVSLERDVLFLGFRFYATQTILLQRSTELATSSQVQQQVVNCAQKCFESFTMFIENGSVIESVYTSWDILCYCLSPLCVLTYNIICTRNEQDLHLMDTYASFVRDRIIKESPDNPLARRVYDLCVACMTICKQLASRSTANAATVTTAAATTMSTASTAARRGATRKNVYPTNHTPRRKNFMNFDTFFTSPGSSSGEQRAAGGNEEEARQESELLLKLLAFRPRIVWDYS